MRLKNLLILSLLFLINGCKKEETNQIKAEITYKSLCHGLEIKSQKLITERNQSCILYSYNSSTRKLKITHANAGFNCCPEEITCNAELTGNKLILTEKEKTPGCNCLCIYDIDIEVSNLNPGEYNLIIVELYRGVQEELSNTINLNLNPNGEFCANRTEYPWGLIE